MKNYIKAIGLAVMGLCFGSSFAQTTILTENFATASSGNNTLTSGSGTAWSGNTNFPTVTRVFQAGGAIRLASGSGEGIITSKSLDLSLNGGNFTLKFDVKGWSSIESQIKVTVTGQTANSISYTATISSPFETITLDYIGGTANSTIKLETVGGRAFLDNVIVTSAPVTSTTWTVSGWNRGAPTATIDAVIAGNYNASQPAITAKNLSIQSGNLIVGENGLDIKGTLSKTGGTVDCSNGGITFSGTTAQVIPANFFVNNTIKDLTLSNATGLSLNGALNLKGVLNVTSGTLATNGNLTLKSTAEGSSRIAPVSGNITGEVTVERFIPRGKRAFRFLTPSVTTTNFISNNWQLATHITGSQTGENGFDQTTTGNSSLYIYENSIASGSGWKSVENTNATNLLAGNGYRLLVRGNRNVDLTQYSAADMNEAVTLTAKGNLIFGEVVFDASSTPAINATTNGITNGYSLVGNPYVSPVDWHLVTKSGIEDTYYTWDPNMGTVAERGRYVAYSQSIRSNSLAESQINQFIQPGQAFFVKNFVLGTAGTLTFNESHKASQFSQVFRNSAQDNSVLKISVYETNEVALGSPIDGAVAVFGSNFDNEIGLGDVEKMLSSGEHLGFTRNTKTLAIEALGELNSETVLFLKTIQFQGNKSYTFKMASSNFTENTTAFLIDRYLNTTTEINLSQDNFIAFSTTSDVNSFATDRFKVVLNATTLGNETWTDNGIKVYPNPIENGEFNIALPKNIEGNVTVNLYNLVGQKIYSTSFQDQNLIHVTPDFQMNSGIYILEIVNGTKLLKQKIAVK